MKKLLSIIVLGLLLSGNAYAKNGKGELKLSQQTMEHLMIYLNGAGNPKYSDSKNKKNNPMVFVVSEDGNSSYYYFCAYSTCADANESYKAKLRCEKESGGSTCYTFAKKRKIVWVNSINTKKRNIKKKELQDPVYTAQIIQELGFYDEDVTQLIGINPKTGDYDKDKSITGEELKNQNKGNTVEQLEALTSLFKAGALTKKEYDKAKEKVLND